MNRTATANGPAAPALEPSPEPPPKSRPSPADRGYQSDDLDQLAVALADAWLEIENPTKDHENPFHGSKYADLAAVLNACRKPLAKHGLTVIQAIVGEHGEPFLRTTLIHKSGQWMAGEAPLAPLSMKMQKDRGDQERQARPDGQGFGSLLTYMRRYCLAAIAGVAQEDDDGNLAQSRPQREQRRQDQPRRDDRRDRPTARPQPADAPRGRPEPLASSPPPPPPELDPARLDFAGRNDLQNVINEYEADWSAFCVQNKLPHERLIANAWQAFNGLVTLWIEANPAIEAAVTVMSNGKRARKRGLMASKIAEVYQHDAEATKQDMCDYLDRKRDETAAKLGVKPNAEPKEEALSNG